MDRMPRCHRAAPDQAPRCSFFIRTGGRPAFIVAPAFASDRAQRERRRRSPLRVRHQARELVAAQGGGWP
jgi:hypothetical protein